MKKLFALLCLPFLMGAIQYIPGTAGQLFMLGLSSDTKPSIANGHIFIETDTDKLFVREAGSWVEKTNAAFQDASAELDNLIDNCVVGNDSTPIPDTCVGDGVDDSAAGGAPDDADYLVGTINGSLSAEIVVGTTPGGELGNTWASPTLDDSLTVNAWAVTNATGTTAAADDSDTSLATTAFVQGEVDDVDLLSDNCVLENDATPVPDSCVGNGSDADTDTDTTNFDADGDNNTPQTINATNELLLAGGTNGIDTVASATDTITFNLDLSESASGGELGGNLNAPTIDDGVTVDAWVMGASTATSPAANDSDTSLATSAFVQGEIDDGDNLTDNCVLEADATPIPDSCVGDGSDAGGSYSFNADGDNNSPQAIDNTNELLIAGGTNGIDTVAGATDTVTLNLDLSESAAGGELGGNLDAPTLDDSVAVSGWTLTSPNYAAGSASAGSWPNYTSGTVLTAAEDGALELDGDALYFTTDADNRGNVSVEHFRRAAGDENLNNSGTIQPLFDAPNAITLETGAYIFEMQLIVTSMSASSGNAAIVFTCGGTCADWNWSACGLDNSTPATIGSDLCAYFQVNTSAASVVTAAAGTALRVSVKGSVEVTGAGTFTPQITLVNAAAAVVESGSYFTMRRVGATTATLVGQWG